MAGYERNTGKLPVLKDKYVPIPQWNQKDKKIVGVKDLYLVHTVESDYWIKKVEDIYEVYEAHLQVRQLSCISMPMAIKYIEEVSKAKLWIWEKED